MSNLNLTKYIGEVASAIVETKLKMTDLPAIIEVCSFLHRRYADMSNLLLECWHKTLTLKKDDKIANPSKLRVDLRLYSEMVACGIFSLKEGLPLLGQVLTMLVAIDKEEHGNISIILAFCKHCGDDYAGLIPRRIRILSDKHRYELPQSDLLPAEKQKNVRQMLRDYYNSVKKHVQAEYLELQNTERANRRILLTKGEVHNERLEKVNQLQSSFDKLMASCEQLAEVLDEDLPELKEPKRTEEADLEDLEMEEMQVEVSTLGNLWEDDETKSFYEDLVDLKAFIPAILYKDSSQQVGIQEDNIEYDQENEDLDAETELSQMQEVNDEEVTPPNVEGNY